MRQVLAAIEVGFDPIARLASLAVSWQVLGVVVASFVAVAAAALLARREAAWTGQDPLRADDLLFVVLGVVPGAVIGGRIVHALDFFDFYSAQPAAVIDPARGSLSLLGAVVGGALTGAYIAHLLDGKTRRWAGIAAVPMLLGIGLGKVAQFLGGGGQGTPFDGDWAVAFTGAGPWLSSSPAIPAHPSQMYEALWSLAGVPVMLVLGLVAARRARRAEPAAPTHALRLAQARPIGSRPKPEPADAIASRAGLTVFLAALAWWLLGRFLVGFTWRDDRLVGPLNVEQALALVLLAGVVAALGVSVARPVVRRTRRRGVRAGRTRASDAGADLAGSASSRSES